MLCLPFAEDRETSLRALGLTDTFGQGFSSAQLQSMRQLEEGQTESMVVILSDVQLDKPLVRISTTFRNPHSIKIIHTKLNQVLEKLLSLFQGFEQAESVPLFVLMGSFLTQPIGRSAGGRSKVLIETFFKTFISFSFSI